MKKKTSGRLLLIAIGLMLILALLSWIWIIHRENEMKAAREREEAARQLAEEKQRRAEEEEAARKKAEEDQIASHVYSHRGSAGPEEHSFKAYDEAIEAGSHYIEQDIVISSDGVLYVSHDLNAVSMTGHDGMYEDMSSETIDGLTTKAGSKVLRLSEVFDRYDKDINYVIELKDDSEACVEAFTDIVDQYGYSDVITVQSRWLWVLETLEQKYPVMPKLYVCRSQADLDLAAGEAYVDIISVRADAGLMTQYNCDAVHESGKLFSAWTLDSEEAIRNAIDIGVDTYFTNETALALKLEREYGLGEGRRGGQ